MIKLTDILNEAPLGTYTTIGGFEKGASYKDPRDRAALNHPVTIQKVKDMLKSTSVDFDFYFVNKPGLRKFSEKGRVSYDFIVKPYPDGLGIDPNRIEINNNNITVFFVGNTAADKMAISTSLKYSCDALNISSAEITSILFEIFGWRKTPKIQDSLAQCFI